jgi:AbrB family looped-hinge helix DNA binding protein
MARTTATLARLTGNHQISIPKPIRDALGLKLGDFFEVRAERGVVVMRPKALEDKATLQQLKKDLEASKAAAKAGRVLGPFDSAGAAMKAVKAYARRAHRAVRP